MVYRAIGLMSGSSLDGLDIAFVEFQEQAGKWSYEIKASACYPYSNLWSSRLESVGWIEAEKYMILHAEYGQYIGEQVNKFINENGLQYQVGLIASHGHTAFHIPSLKMTAQLGDGAAIAAITQLPVVSDLRALDIAFGGQGAPIVPIGEKKLLSEYDYFLNIGGIANLSANSDPYIAFDICPANRVLNMLSNEINEPYDNGGKIAATGTINQSLLEKLNALDYYKLPYPKSLANYFGTDVIYPLIKERGLTIKDELRTFVEHIVIQISNAINSLNSLKPQPPNPKLLVTGGGAFNTFLLQKLTKRLSALNVEVIVPDATLINYKEALIMAFIGVLRWREEYNVLASVTGAARNSIGGALWLGQEA
jgi:anhydro-N-acetylmuramic acid kinase